MDMLEPQIMDKLEPFQAFSFVGNASHSWKIWPKHFDFYLNATNMDSKSDETKTSILWTCIGQKRRELYETFAFEPGGQMKLASVLSKFSNFPKTHPCVVTGFSRTCSKKFKIFMILALNITKLKKVSSKCKFHNLLNTLIKDMFVCGTRDNSLNERLLQEWGLTPRQLMQGN